MAEDMLARLQSIDRASLTDVIRQDQRSPSFAITAWSIERLSDKGIQHPDGLWLISGDGHAGTTTQSWSVVVKIFERPSHETSPESRQYWKRELLVAQSGVLERLPGPIRAPRFYRTDEHTDSLWLWMEHVQAARSGAWTLDDYVFAARELGRWNGGCTAMPLPTERWLNKQPHRAWVDQVNPETDWQLPLHQKYISEDIRLRFARLWTEREQFYHVLEGLPQCFAHFDCQRRNLVIQRSRAEQDELVVIDWALCGVGALGIELHALVGGSTMFAEWPSSAVGLLNEAALRSYVQGLRDVGWSGDSDTVRLAYLTCLAIYRGAPLPGGMTWICAPESRSVALQAFGMAEEDLYQHLLPLLYYWLDCADEARVLMQQMGSRIRP